jgi:hypothetical protein
MVLFVLWYVKTIILRINMKRNKKGINEGPVKKGGNNGPARTPPPLDPPKPRPMPK